MKNVYRLLKINRIIKGVRLKYAALLGADILGIRHLSVRLDPVMACNLRCQMCYFSDDGWRSENGGKFTAEDICKIAQHFFPKALQLVVGCSAEPTLYSDYPSIVRLGKEYGIPYVSLVTNGQLLTEDSLDKLHEAGLDELMLSTHGIRSETYERLMCGASHDRHLRLLELLGKRRHSENRLELRINYTVNPDNLDELRDFFSVYGACNPSTLQVRPIMDLGNTQYRTKDLTPHMQNYLRISDVLAEECRRRSVVFLATKADPTYRSDNCSAGIAEALLRYVAPKLVWKENFRWREETYRAYCRRIGWRKGLLKTVITGKLPREMLGLARRSLTYDVSL